MKKAWSVVFALALLLIALGGVVFGLSLIMDADLVRVADAVFGRYDLAKVIVAVREAFGFFWVGFYRAAGGDLRLGPFQGTVACYRIRKGRGVCGTAFAEGRSIVVADVEQFPGHIACSSLSRSEIVVPLFSTGSDRTVRGVLDIDSDRPAAFDETDRCWLERIAALTSETIY